MQGFAGLNSQKNVPLFNNWHWQDWQQESLADARVTRDSNACMNAPMVEIYAQLETHPRTKPVAKLWPIYILKMAVGRHLEFYRTGYCAIRSADAENPNLEPNMVCTETSNASFSRYSPLNYTVTLKLRFQVTQDHRKRYYSIEHIRIYIRLTQ